jgi:hypothetical protein
MTHCPSGKIHRKGYTRKAYRRADGSHVRSARVTGKCIRDQGARGEWKDLHKEEGIGKLKEGHLSSLGYSLRKSARSRHTALHKAVRKYGPLSTYRKLNALAVYTKRTSPLLSRKAKADRNYVGKEQGY